MNTIEQKIKQNNPKDRSRSNTWFAWFPVQSGALGTGRWMWLKRVWRNKCCGVIIYQPLDT